MAADVTEPGSSVRAPQPGTPVNPLFAWVFVVLAGALTLQIGRSVLVYAIAREPDKYVPLLGLYGAVIVAVWALAVLAASMPESRRPFLWAVAGCAVLGFPASVFGIAQSTGFFRTVAYVGLAFAVLLAVSGVALRVRYERKRATLSPPG